MKGDIIWECRKCRGLFSEFGEERGLGGGMKKICPHCGYHLFDAVGEER